MSSYSDVDLENSGSMACVLHQAITRTNDDFSSVGICDPHLKSISLDVRKISINKMSLTITLLNYFHVSLGSMIYVTKTSWWLQGGWYEHNACRGAFFY